MLSTDALLVLYYVGFGFVALLGWAAIAGDLNEPFDDQRRTSWNRAALIVAFVGIAHPALPLIARDIARQTARPDDGDEPIPTTALVTISTACAALSIAGAVAVIAFTTGQ